jgi:hypothetical protein
VASPAVEQCAKNGESLVLPSLTVQPVAVVAKRSANRRCSIGCSGKRRGQPGANQPRADRDQTKGDARCNYGRRIRRVRRASLALVLLEAAATGDFERNVLLLCGMELDTRMATARAPSRIPTDRTPRLYWRSRRSSSPPGKSSPERPLRYWRLYRDQSAAARPLITSALWADERIVNYLKGLTTR